VADVWRALLAGSSGIRSLDCSGGRGDLRTYAADVQGLDPAGLGIHPRDARIMGKHSHMLIKASQDAHTSAGLDRTSVSGGEIGLFAGMGMVDYSVDDLLPAVLRSLREDGSVDYDRFYGGGYQEIYPLWPLSMLNNISFCQAAIGLDIRGENAVFSPHADSGAQAIAEGARTVLEEKARIALAGGVSEVVSAMSIARSHIFGMLDTGLSYENTVCRPFGLDRQGAVLGEGCGIVSLELRSSADKRGVPYITMITGYGASSGRDGSGYGQSAGSISLSMEKALASAGLEPSAIDLIIAHGDGSVKSDRNEAAAISRVFSGHADRLLIYSSKAALGHMLAGSPAVDLIIGSLMIAHGIVPPVSGNYTQDQAINLRVVLNKPLAFRLRRILINALSYEGQCSSIILEAAGDR